MVPPYLRPWPVCRETEASTLSVGRGIRRHKTSQLSQLAGPVDDRLIRSAQKYRRKRRGSCKRTSRSAELQGPESSGPEKSKTARLRQPAWCCSAGLPEPGPQLRQATMVRGESRRKRSLTPPHDAMAAISPSLRDLAPTPCPLPPPPLPAQSSGDGETPPHPV